ncbi:MAG: hypothetical protein SCL54_15020 [Bacillota bacterium]|nr:hypothetical protein [Bacillota bacterium]
MTDSLFFDTDCISAFLWVREQNILALLYPGKIVIPKAAYDELSYPTTPQLKERIDQLIQSGIARFATIKLGTDEYDLYQKLTTSPSDGHKVIGPGEAASIALAKVHDGMVASNNLKDIALYIDEMGLKHITTGDILIEALDKGFITETEGNNIWASMLAKRRKLGAGSFTDYLCIKSRK